MQYEERFPQADGQQREIVLDRIAEALKDWEYIGTWKKIGGATGAVLLVLDREGARPISFVIDVRGATDLEKAATQDLFISADAGFTSGSNYTPTTDEVAKKKQAERDALETKERKVISDRDAKDRSEENQRATAQQANKDRLAMDTEKANPQLVPPSVASTPRPPAPEGAPFPTTPRPVTPPTTPDGPKGHDPKAGGGIVGNPPGPSRR